MRDTSDRDLLRLKMLYFARSGYSWEETPPEIVDMMCLISQHEEYPVLSEEHWLKKWSDRAKNDETASNVSVSLQELHHVADHQHRLQQRLQEIWDAHPWFNDHEWKSLLSLWRDEKKTISTYWLYPLGHGKAWALLNMYYDELRTLHSSLKRPSVRALARDLLRIDESLQTLDRDVDCLFDQAENVLWKWQQEKAHYHRELDRQKNAFRMEELIQKMQSHIRGDVSRVSWADGVLAFASYGDRMDWVRASLVNDVLDAWSSERCNRVNKIMDDLFALCARPNAALQNRKP